MRIERDIYDRLKCPLCGSRVRLTEQNAACVTNGHQFPIENGVVLFEASQDYYWGGWINSAEMDSLLAESKRTGYMHAVDMLFSNRRTTVQNILDERRASWHFLLPLKKRHAALDLGCGMGSISVALAKSFEHVVACDRTTARCEFTQLRAQQEQLHNIIGLVGFKDVAHLPFESNTFDLVVLYGVLEWIPEDLEGNPERIQMQLLRECKRVLKEGGIVCIAIENALAIKYLLGARDDHAHQLRFTTFLPRKVSNLISRHVRNSPYRTYIYSYRGYKNLFSRAGLSVHAVYYPRPDYRDFSMLLDLESDDAMKQFCDSTDFSLIKSIFLKTRVLKHILPGGFLWMLKK